MSLKFRKGELSFYKSSLPKELKKYVKAHPDNEKYVDQFFETYEYNYVKKQWNKREDGKTFMERLRGEQ